MAIYKPEDDDELIGQFWRKDGYEYKLVGIMYDKEDWSYVLARAGRLNKHTQMLSCVCNIDRYGFERIE